MDIIIFLVGFILGAGIVFAIFSMTQRKGEDAKEEMITRMQLQFENLTNKIFKESSEEIGRAHV